MELVGPFPEKTPLNPEVVGIISKNGYRMEKVIYESRPEFYVTACLFIPDGLTDKTPVILNPIGHSDDGFRGPLYQTVILNLLNMLILNDGLRYKKKDILGIEMVKYKLL